MNPGVVLRDVLEGLELTQRDLAMQMGRPAQTVNEIVNGRKRITAQTALEIENAIGLPARLLLRIRDRDEIRLARERGA